MEFRHKAADLWRDILNSKPESIFGHLVDRLENRPGLGDDIAQPGFVGSHYECGGILFLGEKPGNGGTSVSQEDHLQFEKLVELRDSGSLYCRNKFEELMNTLAQEVMPAWGSIQQYVDPILTRAELSLDDIAFINLAKWRMKPKPPKGLFYRAWQAHTEKQYVLLRPGFVVVLGFGARNLFFDFRQHHPHKPDRVVALERSRNDKMPPPPTTRETIPGLAQEIRAWLDQQK